MSWGAAFNNAYGQASSVAQAAADKAMSSAAAAAEAVGRTALAAASATRDAAVTAGSAAKTAVVAAGSAAKSVASAAAKGVGNVAGFGARAVGEVAVKSASVAADLALAPYKAAKAMFAPVKSPANNIVEPCANSWEGKKARLEKRNQLIQDGSKSPNPDTRRAAERFAANNDAVELAKLSKDSYDQYPGPSFDYPDPGPIPPTGWRVVTKAELVQRGVSVQALEDSRAVVYETASDWPGGKKTVMSFRGTADLEDGLVDYDQAMAVPSEQYAAAMKAGHQMAKAYPGAVVTGHSLGGGKAQAAAARSGMGGTMFNSAGLNPETVSGSMPAADQFKQYRTVGDPLTGVQNSPVLQTAIAGVAAGLLMPIGAAMKTVDAAGKAVGGHGLSPEMADYAEKAYKAFPRGVQNLVKDGAVMPPAVGPITTVPAVNDKGDDVSRVNLAGQHSIVSVVNGIEQQKSEDLSTLGSK